MPTVVYSTPADAAFVMKRLKNARPGTERNALLRTAPLPTGSKIEFRDRSDDSRDQGRLMLSRSDAYRMIRVWGIVASLRHEKRSHNTPTPASAQIVLKLSWLGQDSDCYRSFFVRTTAYAADYTPRISDRSSCNLTLGDIVTGVLVRPASDRNSTALEAWSFGKLAECLGYFE